MIGGLLAGTSRRGLVALAVLGCLLVLTPLLVNQYLLSVMLIALYFAYVGQAWNLMMGFAGQLSLGHALYVGLGGYAAGALYVHYGLSPWIGILAAMALAALFGAAIGGLAFRFGIGGVYFALLTIAFAEFTRLGFEHFEWVGGTGGLFLPVENREVNDLAMLRGSPVMFYYVYLGLAAGALLIIGRLINSRLGYYWKAIREDQDAAAATGIDVFRCKMAAVMISAAMAAVGGAILAFYYNNLFPRDVFGMHRSIEIILAPIIGGLGTLFGPLLGAFILSVLGETMTWLVERLEVRVAGVQHLFYGAILFLIIRYLPGGIWPALARRFGLAAPGSRGDG